MWESYLLDIWWVAAMPFVYWFVRNKGIDSVLHGKPTHIKLICFLNISCFWFLLIPPMNVLIGIFSDDPDWALEGWSQLLRSVLYPIVMVFIISNFDFIFNQKTTTIDIIIWKRVGGDILAYPGKENELSRTTMILKSIMLFVLMVFTSLIGLILVLFVLGTPVWFLWHGGEGMGLESLRILYGICGMFAFWKSLKSEGSESI
tara:strand:+ start:209 stop:817 length:609 start_codon:yes stop_codon:yes gene_type:complete